MKSLVKYAALAASLGIGSVAAHAGSDPGDERDFYYRAPGFYHNCFDNPYHPGCRPVMRPHHPRDGFYIQPGVRLELRFGDVYPRRHDDDYGPVVRKARFCTNAMAVGKARSMGVRNIKAYAFLDHILVQGTKRGHRVSVTLSREWGCPAVDY